MKEKFTTSQKPFGGRGEDKKTKAISILREMYLQENRKRLPDFPDYARVIPSYSDRTANGLTRMIIDFIMLTGGQAERINSTGRPIDRRQRVKDVFGREFMIGSIEYVKGSGTNGTADISATINGKSVKIEVKIGSDRQSDAQLKYQTAIESAGGIYYIARTFESFYSWYISTFQSHE